MYFLDVMKTNNAWVGLILDKDIIFVVLSLIIMIAFPKHRTWRIANTIFCKESNLYYLGCPSLVNYEKQNARAHTYTNINAWTLIYTCTHIDIHTHAHTHTYTHAHKDTRMHACVRSRASTHTKCSFVMGGQSLWNHLPYTVKEAGSIELFKQILKTIAFSQSFEIPAF